MANTTIPSELIAADAITGAKIADNAVDSEHYTDGSIDTAHIADDQVTLAKMAGLARGKIIVGDSSGNPAALAIGTNGYVLKSDGTDIAWAADATVAALTSEQVQDIAGAMFSSNTETGITATYQDADGTIDLVVGTLNQNTTGSAATLTTARTIGGTSFDGSANIAVGLAATATTLATARTIGGVSFNGSANINLPGVNSAGNQNVDAALVDGENFKINGGQGTDGQLMTSTGSGVAWEDAPAGGPTFKTFGTDSIMIGDTTTGTIDAANYNTGLGIDVFASLTSGDDNVAVGTLALNQNTTGHSIVAIGKEALRLNTTGVNMVAVGMEALEHNTTGKHNVAIGGFALVQNTTADANVAVGINVLQANTTGASNTAVGGFALDANTTASYNTAVGYGSLGANTTGNLNTAVGYLAATAVTTGVQNTAVGEQALSGVTTTNNNTAVGYRAMTVAGAAECTALGTQALNACSGSENTSVGWQSGVNVSSGSFNVMMGYQAGKTCTTGHSNVLLGNYTMYNGTEGNHNTCVGINAGYHIGNGYRNVAVGTSISIPNNSNHRFAIGYNNGGGANTQDHALSVHSGSSNYVRLLTGSTTVSANSDERLKKDIEDLTYGLSFINRLRPVNYKLKVNSELPEVWKDDDVEDVDMGWMNGFLAQEVKTALDAESIPAEKVELWSEDAENHGLQSLGEAALIPMLVKALQEADDKIDALVARVTTLEG